MSAIRFDGQVAIVTGAGGGLGREHARELARRGAKVLVNDLSAADAVVEEIHAAGGEALASHASVTDADAVEAMARHALDAWGRVDILVANAGILRDRSFGKMSLEDFQAVMEVHLTGTVLPIKAVWETMKAQNYGRVVVTTSASGLYGNFGQANYGAAKMAVVGLMQTLKIEGQRNGIHVNAIAPVAATKMTEDLFPPAVLEVLKPEMVTPGVVYLCSAEAPTGAILTAGAGSFALARVVETEGVHLGHNALSAEAVRDSWAQIGDEDGAAAYFAGGEQAGKFIRKAMG